MKFYRARAIARKEYLHILRDPRSLGMGIVIPVILLLLFGYALSLDVDNVPTVVWDQSESQVSRDLLSGFQGSRYFSIVKFVHSYAEVDRSIDSAEALVALVIPRDFADLIESGRAAPVQVIVDGSDSDTADTAIGYAETVAQSYSQNAAVQDVRRKTGRALNLPLDYRPRTWYNEDMESKNYIVPGLIAVIMMVIAALLTSLTIAREWERGTMEQLISTPVRGPELILGKLFPYFTIGMFDVLLAVLMGEFLFHVPLRGSIPLLFGMAAVFLVGALSLGILISVVTKSQLLASQLAMVLTFLPSFLLSGFMYAISNMPQPIQIITYAIPATYFVSLLKGIYLKGVGLEVMGVHAALLGAFGATMVVLANVKFKKKLE